MPVLESAEEQRGFARLIAGLEKDRQAEIPKEKMAEKFIKTVIGGSDCQTG